MKSAAKTVFIVGGSSGIGLEMAKQLASTGAHVAIFARRKETLEAACAEIGQAIKKRKPAGQKVLSYVLDAADRDAAERQLNLAIADLGVPDLLINSAGGAVPQEFEKVTADDFLRTLQVNVFAAWNPCQVLVPHMKREGRGTIVNVSSVAGVVGTYGYTDYSLAKFGIIGFSEALRGELRPHGIQVQVVCPPDTQTPGFDNENLTKPPETAALSAGTKLMSAEAVARASLKQVGTKRFLIFANRESRGIDLARRFVPAVVRDQMDKIVAKSRSKNKSRSQKG